jgi:hypothetical protein
MKKQTSVEWLQEAISKKLSSEIGPSFLDLFEQAKEMEKEQIKEAFKHGQLPPWFVNFDSEQYYTKTFIETKND